MSTTSTPEPAAGGVAPRRIAKLYARETALYAARRPRSAALAAGAESGYYAGVPLHWMLDWELPFPPVVAHASGATLTDIDGLELADFCLGDTAAMFGHSPPAVVRALTTQASQGLAYMLPTEHALSVGALLRERFGLPHWQVATTASDANRFALRIARGVTGRGRILVFNGCYHGAVDETYVGLEGGRAVNRPGLIGQHLDLSDATRITEFNDLPALERALADREVACVITEPVLTNCGMVLPEAGFHAGLRRLTRDTGTLLLIDETHTISSGPCGYSGLHGLEPDLFVLGKPIAGGVPASVWGFSAEVARGWDRIRRTKPAGHSGLGTTLSANALAMAAMHAVLTEVMTPAAYAHMERLALRLATGLAAAITAAALPWHVVRAGARVEFVCAPGLLRNGSEAAGAQVPALERAIHIALLNRGCLIAPFHNMLLVCPATSAADVERLVAAFAAVAAELSG